jgi:hypothetical protein
MFDEVLRVCVAFAYELTVEAQCITEYSTLKCCMSVFQYEVSRSVLDSRVLWISVWHKEQFGRNEFFGEVNMSLVDTNVDGGDVPYWYKLQPKVGVIVLISFNTVYCTIAIYSHSPAIWGNTGL